MTSSDLIKVTVYTDGACSGNPGPGGWAAILICNGTEKEISGYEAETTNNRMELTAVIEALKALKTPCRVDIFTDSTYVANSFINKWVYGWKKKAWKTENGGMRLNHDLWEELLRLSEKHVISWNVVKGHGDNEYNNRCDKLAVSMYSSKKKEEKNNLPDNYVLEDSDEAPGNASDNSEKKTKGLEEQCISSKNIFTGKIFMVNTLDVLLPDGTPGYRELVSHNGGAGILALDDENNVYLVDQYRTGAGKVMTEIPAGKLEKGEKPIICAERELLEEIGATADNIRLLSEFYVTPAYNTEKTSVFLATDLKFGQSHPDDGEFISVKKIPLTDAINMVAAGDIVDAKTIIALTLTEKLISD